MLECSIESIQKPTASRISNTQLLTPHKIALFHEQVIYPFKVPQNFGMILKLIKLTEPVLIWNKTLSAYPLVFTPDKILLFIEQMIL